jgi:hypothetical protein
VLRVKNIDLARSMRAAGPFPQPTQEETRRGQ